MGGGILVVQKDGCRWSQLRHRRAGESCGYSHACKAHINVKGVRKWHLPYMDSLALRGSNNGQGRARHSKGTRCRHHSPVLHLSQHTSGGPHQICEDEGSEMKGVRCLSEPALCLHHQPLPHTLPMCFLFHNGGT